MSNQQKKQKYGILGGTFDPVHKGHLRVASSVLERYRLDRILFIPAFSPPHKEGDLTPFSHRVAMLELCLENEDRMEISILESERNSPSYTVETLRELHQRIHGSSFYLIMGADMFVEIELWYRFADLFKLAHIIVAARPGISRDSVVFQASRLPGGFMYDRDLQKWTRDDGAMIFYLDEIEEAVSSSEIRERSREGLPVSNFVTDSVHRYIREHGLYGCSND